VNEKIAKKTERKMGYQEIVAILPHRPPFLMIDTIVSMELGKSIRATKCMSANEPYFAGHFPGCPIMPGVLIVEAMAQASAALFFTTFRENGTSFDSRCNLTSIDKVKFRKPIVPGDCVEIFVRHVRSRGMFIFFEGEAIVGGEVVAEARFGARFFKEGEP
jgi:3-hydroxyacyl-[acyl-carrier-protein] dehydratase